MEEVIEIETDGVTSFVEIGGDTDALTIFTSTVLSDLANNSRDGSIRVVGPTTLPEDARSQNLIDFVYNVDDSSLGGGSAENLLDRQLGVFGLDIADYFDLASDIGDGSIFGGGSGGGGSSGSSGGGGGGGGGGTRTGLTADQVDFDALEREGQRLGLEAERLGVTAAEIGALQSLNAEDRALIGEQFDLQREEVQRAYVVQADPARGAANALSAGNFKSGVNGYAARVRGLVQATAVDQLENARSRSLNSNSQQGVRLDASAQRNAIDQAELGLAQDAFNDQVAEINSLLNVSDVVGGGGNFGETVLGGMGLNLGGV